MATLTKIITTHTKTHIHPDPTCPGARRVTRTPIRRDVGQSRASAWSRALCRRCTPRARLAPRGADALVPAAPATSAAGAAPGSAWQPHRAVEEDDGEDWRSHGGDAQDRQAGGEGAGEFWWYGGGYPYVTADADTSASGSQVYERYTTTCEDISQVPLAKQASGLPCPEKLCQLPAPTLHPEHHTVLQ